MQPILFPEENDEAQDIPNLKNSLRDIKELPAFGSEVKFLGYKEISHMWLLSSASNLEGTMINKTDAD